MGLASILATVTKSSQDGFISRALQGAGIAFASYSINRFYLEDYINQYIASLNGTSAFGASLIHMSSLDIYMQTVLTAILIAMAQNSSQIFLKKA